MAAAAAIERSEGLDTTVKGKYSIWRRDYDSPNSDSTLKLMRDQLLMAKAYANIAKSKNKTSLYNTLLKHSRESQCAIEEASSDAELHPRYCKSLSTVLVTRYTCLLLEFMQFFSLFLF
jgi:alpha-1,4-galacturonosyltransferase